MPRKKPGESPREPRRVSKGKTTPKLPEAVKEAARGLKRRTAKKGGKNGDTVWQGPEKDGITQSLLSLWLVCRERFRLLTVEGLKPRDEFSYRMEYGSMWHEAEADTENWSQAATNYARELKQRYPEATGQIAKALEIVHCQFPIYMDYFPPTKYVETEMEFAEPYELPSGRVVLLRGKMDGVLKKKLLYLRENKVKGEVNIGKIQAQLPFDLQTMLYMTAMERLYPEAKVGGVDYNVVQRPLSGGKHSISQRKGRQTKKGLVGAETTAEFYARLTKIIETEPEHFFHRWTLELAPSDIERFATECLEPVLEQLCDWWQVVADDGNCKKWAGPSCLHYRMPYGIWHPILEGATTPYDNYLQNGDESGLERVTNLFPELG